MSNVNVMADNLNPLLVPCHSAVRSDGRMRSYAFGADRKARLLKREGVSPEELAGAPYLTTPISGVVSHATCRKARRIQPENCRYFHRINKAIAGGYRPGKVCRPVVA